MRVTFLAPLALMLFACQSASAPEDDEMLDRASPSSATPTRFIVDADVVEDGHTPSEPEEHSGC